MIIDYKDLKKIREENKDKKIVFCLGVFDITHVGHILFFEDCKSKGDILVVGIGRDSLIKRYKGDLRPILNENIRLKTVDSIKAVDYSFIDTIEDWDGSDTHKKNLRPIFRELKPDFYVVNNDASDLDKRQEIAKEEKVNMIVLPRWCPKEFEGISTTKIIEKIKEAYK